jgi:protein gp37
MVSTGCRNCYAKRLAEKFKGDLSQRYRNGFKVTLQEDLLEEPLSWKTSRRIFVCSMSDLFHEEVPFEYVERVFDIMRRTKRHTYQVLTKRAERMRDIGNKIGWPSNVWAGVTVEHPRYVPRRIALLRETGARVRFVSFEPLLAEIERFDFTDIDWIIVGGERGNKVRPMDEEWALSLLAQARIARVPFFFKQHGSTAGKLGYQDHLLGGKKIQEFPEKTGNQPGLFD